MGIKIIARTKEELIKRTIAIEKLCKEGTDKELLKRWLKWENKNDSEIILPKLEFDKCYQILIDSPYTLVSKSGKQTNLIMTPWFGNETMS